MIVNKIRFVSSRYAGHPDAAAFNAVLAEHLPAGTEDRMDYVWDAPIPAREDWEREAAALAAHLKSSD